MPPPPSPDAAPAARSCPAATRAGAGPTRDVCGASKNCDARTDQTRAGSTGRRVAHRGPLAGDRRMSLALAAAMGEFPFSDSSEDGSGGVWSQRQRGDSPPSGRVWVNGPGGHPTIGKARPVVITPHDTTSSSITVPTVPPSEESVDGERRGAPRPLTCITRADCTDSNAPMGDPIAAVNAVHRTAGTTDATLSWGYPRDS